MAKRRRRPLPATGPDAPVDAMPEHEGPPPERGDVAGRRRWLQVRAARLKRERGTKDPRLALMPWIKV